MSLIIGPFRARISDSYAGGGTLDISAYAIRATSPLVIEEIAPPDCIFAGSVFVSRRAREFLQGLSAAVTRLVRFLTIIM